MRKVKYSTCCSQRCNVIKDSVLYTASTVQWCDCDSFSDSAFGKACCGVHAVFFMLLISLQWFSGQ